MQKVRVERIIDHDSSVRLDDDVVEGLCRHAEKMYLLWLLACVYHNCQPALYQIVVEQSKISFFAIKKGESSSGTFPLGFYGEPTLLILAKSQGGSEVAITTPLIGVVSDDFPRVINVRPFEISDLEHLTKGQSDMNQMIELLRMRGNIVGNSNTRIFQSLLDQQVQRFSFNRNSS